jgi:hypothetical protein
MTIKYASIFHFKALQNIPKSGFLVLKQTIWQPCSWQSKQVFKKFFLLSDRMLRAFYKQTKHFISTKTI